MWSFGFWRFLATGMVVESQARAWYQNQNRAPFKNDKNNGPSERMIRQTIHLVISKSINNQKKSMLLLNGWCLLYRCRYPS